LEEVQEMIAKKHLLKSCSQKTPAKLQAKKPAAKKKQLLKRNKIFKRP
jgi:hypothetical protein